MGLEIACDESGYEGDRLVGSTTTHFAHAAVHLGEGAAAELLAELRGLIRSPATQYSATHLLREKHRAVLEWFLGAAAPLRGLASVFLVDKEFYVLGRVAELLLTDDGFAPGGPALPDEAAALLALDHPHRTELLRAANELLRRRGSAEPFFRALAVVRESDADPLLARLAGGEARAVAYRRRLVSDGTAAEGVDPLTPALVAAVARWGSAADPVTVAHDRQISLTAGRIRRLRETTGPALAGIRMVAADDDPRIQLADIMAGTVAAVWSGSRGSNRKPRQPVGTPPLDVRPFIDARSILPPTASTRAADRPTPDIGPAVSD